MKQNDYLNVEFFEPNGELSHNAIVTAQELFAIASGRTITITGYTPYEIAKEMTDIDRGLDGFDINKVDFSKVKVSPFAPSVNDLR